MTWRVIFEPDIASSTLWDRLIVNTETGWGMDDHGVNYDFLEDQLRRLPPGPRYAPVVMASGWKMSRTARKLKRNKKKVAKSGKHFSLNVPFAARRPLASVGGWVSSNGSYTYEDEKCLREFFEKHFKPKGLVVGEIRAGWRGMECGGDGNFEMLDVMVTVS